MVHLWVWLLVAGVGHLPNELSEALLDPKPALADAPLAVTDYRSQTKKPLPLLMRV